MDIMSSSTPNGSGSRLSQILQRTQSPASEARSDTAETESSLAVQTEARFSSYSRPRAESSSVAGSVPSSLSQKTPVRSYFQRPFHGLHSAIDTPQSISRSIREDTAELASRALSEAGSISAHKSSPFSQTTALDERLYASPRRDAPVQQKASESDDFEIIEETSEPSSPHCESATHRPLGKSVLAEMIQNCPRNDNGTVTSDGRDDGRNEDDDQFGTVVVSHAIISQPHETTPLLRTKDGLLARGHSLRTLPRDIESRLIIPTGRLKEAKQNIVRVKNKLLCSIEQITTSPKHWNKRWAWDNAITKPASYLPAVAIGLLLNVLDAISYGMILFPLGQPIFANLGPDGISMFYVSCIISQLVYSLGGSIFKGGVGSEMIEVVPFFHKMAFTIMGRMSGEDSKAIIATTVLSYAISSVLTGVVFWIMGKYRLGTLMGFFPRHILVGCIGGVGLFLLVTGIEVSARLSGNLDYNMETIRKLLRLDTIFLWTTPLALAITLLIIKQWVKHPLADATFFVVVLVVFYVVVFAIPELDLSKLRSSGWVFEAPVAGVPFYHFWSLYDFTAINWAALASTVPAMFALAFFGILHVPINVPALGLSTGEDNLEIDRELQAHGYSNIISGLCGSIQNYLVYSNTVLFMRSGGNSRVAGVMLAMATCGILVVGTVIIGYIPVMAVGTLVFFLGTELLREALITPFGRLHYSEYVTIIIIVMTMGFYDFVVGIGVGIMLACVSFVLQASQISAIRGTFPGGLASSTVRRHPVQRRFLHEAGKQIYVMKLAGYLFFGTIVGVENRIRALLRDESFNSQPIQFLVIDLSKVDGGDFSATEAFARIGRILTARSVRMIMCGFALASNIGKSLASVGLLEVDEVQYFEELNSALEYCENELLKAFYQRRDAMNTHPKPLNMPPPDPFTSLEEPVFNSPRRNQLRTVATTTLEEHQSSTNYGLHDQPLQLILQTFSALSDKDDDFWQTSVSFFEKRSFAAGTVLYNSGDVPDGFYLLERGLLKAKYGLPQGTFSEVIVAGATCGELPFFSSTLRTSTTIAETDCIAWVLDNEKWSEMQEQKPEVVQELLKIGLKLTSERMDAITKYMLMTAT